MMEEQSQWLILNIMVPPIGRFFIEVYYSKGVIKLKLNVLYIHKCFCYITQTKSIHIQCLG